MSEVVDIKEGYKETPLGLIPDDWKLEELGIVAKVNMGQSPPSSSYNENGDGLPLIQGNADIKNRLSVPRIWTSEPSKECESDEIIMTVRAPVGAVAKSTIKACIGRGVCSIRSTKEASSEFIYQHLISLESKWSKLEQGSTFTAVNGSDIRSLKIPLPPLPEQQKIAAILSTVDDKIEVIDERIQQTQELKKGLMQRLLTRGIGHTEFKDSPLGEIPASWEDLNIGDLVKFSGGAQPPRSTFKFEPSDGYIRLIQTRDYKSDKYPTYISEELARKKCKSDDIMIGRYGPPIFQIFRGLSGAYNVALIKAIPFEEKILKEYLYYYIIQYRVWAFVENLSQRSGGQTGVDLEKLRTYPLPLPAPPEQQKIAEILTSVDHKIEILKEKKSDYQQLKKGLMQQLLTGKIRVMI